MDDIMCEASSFEIGNKILLISELYKIYTQHHPSEQFDKFYFWGELLINDFDLIDKYMIDADMLFSNIYDLKELEADLSYLTPEMRQIINSFWKNFSVTENLSEEKQKFLTVWQSLAPIYHAFHARMEEMGMAYTGKIYRSAVDNIAAGAAQPDTSRHYVFIGFNALSECEKRMLKFISTNCKCDFAWDYDNYYTDQQEQEAGKFLRENLKLFPATVEVTHNNFLNIKKDIQAISTATNVMQCKYVNKLLHNISPELEFDKRTAIVLTDESLLIPLLHSLPEKLQNNVNITMGYPLRPTTAYSLIERLLELQKNSRVTDSSCNFYHVDATGILSHPYIVDALDNESLTKYNQIIRERLIRVDKSLFEGIELLNTIFSATDDYNSLSKYLLDVITKLSELSSRNGERSLKLAYLSILADNIAELSNCLHKCDIEITIPTYTSLLRRHLQGVRIPFTGEPLQGLQIMGILETRNLDFDNVIILSMNDDNFPGNTASTSSFIPYNLRAAYGVPTPEHHEGVYAYYFYRLIQRAKRVDMLYCSRADKNTTGEQSRYIYQLDFESPYRPQRTNVGVDVAIMDIPQDTIEKSGKTLEELERYIKGEKILAPSTFSNYVACPMRFYLSSIARLRNPDELEEEVDGAMFGNILHSAMDELYSGLINNANTLQYLERITPKQIEKAVINAINEKYLKSKDTPPESYMGTLTLIMRIICDYISKGIIPYDKAHYNFVLTSTEEEISTPLQINDNTVIRIGGRADRIDSMNNGILRVVDYKTSKDKHCDFSDVDAIFNSTTRNEMGYILQTLIYSMVLYKERNRDIQPALYYARHMLKPDFSPYLRMGKRNNKCEILYSDVAEEFESALKEKLNELFDTSIPFKRCDISEIEKTCKYCDFRALCKREVFKKNNN